MVIFPNVLFLTVLILVKILSFYKFLKVPPVHLKCSFLLGVVLGGGVNLQLLTSTVDKIVLSYYVTPSITDW